MALVSKKTICPLCQELISKPIFATSGIFIPPTNPLWRYCDAAMHWACYATWEHRERFAREYVQMWIENEKDNPNWARVFLDRFSFITLPTTIDRPRLMEGERATSPFRREVLLIHKVLSAARPEAEALIDRVHVHLFRTGSRLEIPFREWELYMGSKEGPRVYHVLETEAWNEALPSIRMALPTAQALLQAADWDGKEILMQRIIIRDQEQSERRLRAIATHNQLCEGMRKQLVSAGLTCPHCLKHSTKIRYYDKAPDGKSYFVCQSCARSFWSEDLLKRPN